MVRTVHERDGAWLRIVLDHPPGNLLSLDMVRALAAVLDAEASARKWVTFEGAGEHFCFGARIQEHVPGPMEQVLPETHALFRLALTCDVVIASEDATLGLPEINLGAFPPAGPALLALRVGVSRSTSTVLTGEAQSALEWSHTGLIERVARCGELIGTAREWFDRRLQPRSRVALAAAAQASRIPLRSMAEPAIAAAEKLYLERLLHTNDAAEGVRAFLEKRAPRWKDQ
jgi:cyclohexa-1,5-dienecarbonyl-CoA hydratase